MPDFHLSRINCALGRGCSAGATENGSLGMMVGCFVAEAAAFASDSDCRRLPAISTCHCNSLASNLGGATIGNRPRLCTKPSNQTLKQSLPPCLIHILQYVDWVWSDGELDDSAGDWVGWRNVGVDAVWAFGTDRQQPSLYKPALGLASRAAFPCCIPLRVQEVGSRVPRDHGRAGGPRSHVAACSCLPTAHLVWSRVPRDRGRAGACPSRDCAGRRRTRRVSPGLSGIPDKPGDTRLCAKYKNHVLPQLPFLG